MIANGDGVIAHAFHNGVSQFAMCPVGHHIAFLYHIPGIQQQHVITPRPSRSNVTRHVGQPADSVVSRSHEVEQVVRMENEQSRDPGARTYRQQAQYRR